MSNCLVLSFDIKKQRDCFGVVATPSRNDREPLLFQYKSIMLFIKNLTKSKVDEEFLQRVAEKALKNLPKISRVKKIEIELVIIGKKRMKGLNQVWRGKDAVTDVLSFGNNDGKKKTGFILVPDNINNMGEIFICYPAAARQARQYDSSVKEEMARLLVHGILHLAGYDHEKSAKEEKKMFRLQEKILGKI